MPDFAQNWLWKARVAGAPREDATGLSPWMHLFPTRFFFRFFPGFLFKHARSPLRKDDAALIFCVRLGLIRKKLATKKAAFIHDIDGGHDYRGNSAFVDDGSRINALPASASRDEQ